MCRICEIAFLNVDYLVLSRIEFHVAKLPIFSSLRLLLFFLFLLPALTSFLIDLHNPLLSAGFPVLPFTLYQVTRTPSSASPSSGPGNLLPGAVTPLFGSPIWDWVCYTSQCSGSSQGCTGWHCWGALAGSGAGLSDPCGCQPAQIFCDSTTFGQ